jgi:hypothetical protein
MGGDAHRDARMPGPRSLAAALAFASQAVHLWVLPGQLAAAIPPGLFFFLVAAGEGLLGASLLLGGGRWTARLGVLLNVLVVLVWLLTRAVSIPQLFEPVRLPVEGLGALATATEVALVFVLVSLERSLSRDKRWRRAL